MSLWISLHVQFNDELKFHSQGRDLQELLEKTFLDKKKDSRFCISDQNYILSFDSSGDMSQKNVIYGTVKKVRRRPAKFVSKDDISQLIRYLCDFNYWKGDKLWPMICSEYNETNSWVYEWGLTTIGTVKGWETKPNAGKTYKSQFHSQENDWEGLKTTFVQLDIGPPLMVNWQLSKMGIYWVQFTSWNYSIKTFLQRFHESFAFGPG